LEVFHKEIETCHPKKHKQGIGAAILRETDVVGHEGQREGAGEGNERRKLSCKEIDHGNGKGPKDQRDDSEITFGFGERIELMGEEEEERRVKIRWILFIKFYLAFEVISGVIEGVDFIHPEGFLIEGIESQGEADEETKKKNKKISSCFSRGVESCLH